MAMESPLVTGSTVYTRGTEQVNQITGSNSPTKNTQLTHFPYSVKDNVDSTLEGRKMKERTWEGGMVTKVLSS